MPDFKPIPPKPRGAPPEIIVHFHGRVHRVTYHDGETLLESLRRAGLAIPFVCRQGVCGTCMVRCLAGEVSLRENHVLSDEDLAQGYRLACQGVPDGTVCEIEVEG